MRLASILVAAVLAAPASGQCSTYFEGPLLTSGPSCFEGVLPGIGQPIKVYWPQWAVLPHEAPTAVQFMLLGPDAPLVSIPLELGTITGWRPDVIIGSRDMSQATCFPFACQYLPSLTQSINLFIPNDPRLQGTVYWVGTIEAVPAAQPGEQIRHFQHNTMNFIIR